MKGKPTAPTTFPLHFTKSCGRNNDEMIWWKCSAMQWSHSVYLHSIILIYNFYLLIYWFMSGQGSSGPGNNYRVYECLWSMVPCFMIFQIDFWPEKQMFNVCVLLLYVILTSFFAWKFCHKEDTDKKGPRCESQHASWCHLVSSWSFHMIYTSSHSLFSPQYHQQLLLHRSL